MFRRLTEQDFYEVLEVGYTASPEEIQTAYECAREIYSNDSLVSTSILSKDERRHILRRVTEAYQTLIAEDSRRLYDESLFGEELPQETICDSSEPTHDGESKETKRPSEGSRSFPRLVKGAQPAPVLNEPLRRSQVQLGFKEEASGDFLRRARESAGQDLRSIAEETKIGVTMLCYIEEERLDRLPAPVYLKSFVAQYAHCLGLDSEKVVRTYLARIKRLSAKK
jgi:curved DNA-binding protein CbpA